MSELKKENNELIKGFLNRTFFSGWKPENMCKDKYLNYKSLELQISPACDQKCKYCYYAKYSSDLYPADIAKQSLVLKNLDMVLKWLKENNYYPQLELFSGELFVQEVGFKSLEKVIDWQNQNEIRHSIVIPTNYSFLFDDEKTARVESLFKKSKERVFLSASVDGKYCDANRPFVDGKVKDDAYYDRMFKFAKKHDVGFHPMVYSENIEKWKDNFLWFQENFEKYGIDFDRLYLLEVRNKEWNTIQIKEYYKFMRFLINWSWNHVKDFVAPEKFPVYIFDKKLFNTMNIFSTMSRGMGCSMQSTIQLRLGDLTTSVCHRASYKQHNLWRFVTDNDSIVDVEALNYNLTIAVASMDYKNSPFCNYCTIRELCLGQCLGSMFEANGDPFMVIPTVCALEHAKVAAILDELKELDLHHHFMHWAENKKTSLKAYYKYFEGRK